MPGRLCYLLHLPFLEEVVSCQTGKRRKTHTYTHRGARQGRTGRDGTGRNGTERDGTGGQETATMKKKVTILIAMSEE